MLLAAAGALATGCGPEAPDRAELIEVLRDSGLPRAQAECAADAVGDHLSDDQVAAIAERGSSGVEADDDDVDRARQALAACATVGAPTTTTAPAPTDDPTAGTSGPMDEGSPGPDSVGPGPGPTAREGAPDAPAP